MTKRKLSLLRLLIDLTCLLSIPALIFFLIFISPWFFFLEASFAHNKFIDGRDWRLLSSLNLEKPLKERVKILALRIITEEQAGRAENSLNLPQREYINFLDAFYNNDGICVLPVFFAAKIMDFSSQGVSDPELQAYAFSVLSRLNENGLLIYRNK